MKKLLVFVVIAAMVFGTMITSSAFTDVSAGDAYAKAINKGSAVDLWKGTGDGSTFSPDEPFTKEMVSAIAVRLLGYESWTAYYNYKPSFTDADYIPEWAWAYVNVCATFEVITGVPNGDGTYRFYAAQAAGGVFPESGRLISYAEALTIMMKTLGYKLAIPTVGKWYNPFLAMAASEGLLDNVAGFNPEEPAQRGMIAQISWDVAQHQFVTLNTVTNTWAATGQTPVADKLKSTEVTVQIAEITADGFKDTATPANAYKYAAISADDLGKDANIIYDSGKNVSYFSIATAAEDIVTPTLENPSVVDAIAPALDYVMVDDDEGSDIVINAAAVIYVNGTSGSVADLAAANPNWIKVILNSSGEAQAVIATNYDIENSVLTNVTDDEDADTDDAIRIDGALVDITVAADAVITIDGSAATIADVADVNGAVVYARKNAAATKIVELELYSSAITGVVSKTKVVGSSGVTTTYAVLADGTEVEIDAALLAVPWAPITNNEVTLVLNKDGEARIVTADAAVKNFGKVVADLSASSTEIIVNIEGTETTFALATTPTVNALTDAGAASALLAEIKIDNYVYVTLNSAGAVSVIDEFVLTPIAAGRSFNFIDSTNKKLLLDDLTPIAYSTSAVIELIDGSYGELADLVSGDVFSYYLSGGDAIYVKVTAKPTPADTVKYGKYVGYSVDGGVLTLSFDVNGTIEDIVAGADALGVAVTSGDGTLLVPVKIIVNGADGKVGDFADIGFSSVAGPDVVYAVSGSKVYYGGSYAASYTLASTPIVYILESGAYTLGTIADIAAAANFEVFDDGADGTLEVVKIIK